MTSGLATTVLHSGGGGLLLELVGGGVGGLVTAVVLFYLVKYVARNESPDSGTDPGGDEREKAW